MPPQSSSSKPFVYSWGLRARNGLLSYPYNLCTVVVALAALIVVATQASGAVRWLTIGIAACTIPAFVAIALERLKPWRAIPRRVIKVFTHPRRIEFHNAPISTGFFRTELVERYDCPIDELHAYEFTMFSGQGALRLWTARGYIRVETQSHDSRIQLLYAEIEALAGPRPPPLVRRAWFTLLVTLLIAAVAVAVVCAVCLA